MHKKVTKLTYLYENYVVKNVDGNSGEYLRENWERWVYGPRGHGAQLICVMATVGST